jgi:hypothetical protein
MVQESDDPQLGVRERRIEKGCGSRFRGPTCWYYAAQFASGPFGEAQKSDSQPKWLRDPNMKRESPTISAKT